MLIMALVVLGLFTVVGIFYSVLVATMVGQRIWQRHYHILAKRMLTKVSSQRDKSIKSTKKWDNFLDDALATTKLACCFLVWYFRTQHYSNLHFF